VAVIAGKTVADTRLLGPSAQVYAPQKPDARQWTRQGSGGVAATVVAAGRHRNRLWVAGHTAPIYARHKGMWDAQPLPNRGWVRLATSGPTGAVVINRQVYVLGRTGWRRFGRSSGVASAVWAASPNTVYVATTAGHLRRGVEHAGRVSWTLVGGQVGRGAAIVQLVGRSPRNLYAIGKHGSLAAIRGSVLSRVRGVPMVRAAAATRTGIVVVGRDGRGKTVVTTVRKRKLISTAVVPGIREPIAGVARTARGQLIVVTRRGHVYIRDKNAWKTGEVRDPAGVVPARFRGAAPARTR